MTVTSTCSKSLNVTSFSVIKNYSILNFRRFSAYDRFGASYTSININTWSEKDVAYVCHLILQDKSYGLDFETNFDADQEFEPRLQISVQLAMRDAELLRSKKTVARQCPRGFQTSSTYFIVGTIYKDAITVHVKYENNDYAFPETYIQNIQKAEVQAVTSNENLFPSLWSKPNFINVIP